MALGFPIKSSIGGWVRVQERAKHTLCVRHVLDDIAVFDNLDHATDESLRSLGCVVDRYESVRTLGRSGHCF